jgi:hypothetical protein
MLRNHPYNATPQLPIHSGFGPQTTAREVLKGRDLQGTTAIVTGGYSGVGLEITRALAQAGVGRSREFLNCVRYKPGTAVCRE